MPKYKADVTLHIHGSLTVEAKDETEATNKIVDALYGLRNITIDEWEIDRVQEVKE